MARIRTRTGSISDAAPAIAAAMATDGTPWPDATIIDTADRPARALAAGGTLIAAVDRRLTNCRVC